MSPEGPDISIHPVESGDTSWLQTLIDLYSVLLPEYLFYAPLMRERALLAPDADPRSIQHQWVAAVDGQPAALMVFKYVRKSRLGILLDAGVLPPFRQIRVGGSIRFAHFLYLRCMETICADAARFNAGDPLGLLAEAPNAALVRRYVSYGFVELPVDYAEPPGTPELDALAEGGAGTGRTAASDWRPMRLVFLPAALSASEAMQPEHCATLVESLLTDHYGLPYNHTALQRALNSLR